MRERFEHIQALRGVAALLVFAAHVQGAELSYGGDGALSPFALLMGVTGVDLFFLISGFVMAHVVLGGARGPRAAGRFLFNRAARIYPVYWAVTLGLLIFFTGKQFLFNEATPFPNPVETFLLLPDDDAPLLAVGWTLVHELYFYLVISLLVVSRGARTGPFLGVWAAIVFAGVVSGVAAANPWTRIAFSPLTFEFIGGALIAILVRRGVTRFALPALLLGVVAVIGISAGFADRLYPETMADFSRRVLIFGPPYALILYGAAALEASRGPRAPKWLVAAGDASYSLYLVHLPVFLVVGKALSLVVPDSGVFDNALLIGCFLAAGLAAAVVVHLAIEKPALAFTRRLGGRLFSRRDIAATAGGRITPPLWAPPPASSAAPAFSPPPSHQDAGAAHEQAQP
jgi:peptidoglycan/LPS O-acetylase OafA/YrhL